MDSALPLAGGMQARDVDLRTQLAHSMGAVLVGSLIALFLSGAVAMQAVLYYQLYPKDPLRVKVMVAVIWLVDALHSIMTMVANWEYLIDHFGDWEVIDSIVWSIAVSVAFTALMTFIVHCFFIHRIYQLSRGNYFIAVPLVLLTLLRLIVASISTSEMIRLDSFSGFVDDYAYVFTTGLSTAASLDILITAALCYYIRRGRSGFGSMDKIIDALTAYTIENGMLTCVTTVVALVCWLSMPTNLIFLGLHFAISKLYANSFLATLNARKSLLHKSQSSNGDHALPVIFPNSYQGHRRATSQMVWSQRSHTDTHLHLQVAVEKTVQRDVTVIVEEGGGGGVYAPSASVASTSGASSPPPRRDSGSRSGHGKAPATAYLAQ